MPRNEAEFINDEFLELRKQHLYEGAQDILHKYLQAHSDADHLEKLLTK